MENIFIQSFLRFWSCEFMLPLSSVFFCFVTHFCCCFALQGSIKFPSSLFTPSQLLLSSSLLHRLLSLSLLTLLIRSSSLHLFPLIYHSPPLRSSSSQLSFLSALLMFFFLILVLSHPYHLCFHAHFYFLTSFPPLLLLTVSSPSSSPLSLLFLPFPISSLLPSSSSLLAHFRHSAPNSILLSSPDPHLFTFSLILHFISPNFTSWRGQECYSGVTNPRWIPSVWVAGLMSSDQPRQPAATLLPFYWRWVTAIKVTCVCVCVAKCDADLHMCVDYLSLRLLSTQIDVSSCCMRSWTRWNTVKFTSTFSVFRQTNKN